MTALSVIGSRGFQHLETVVPYGIDSELGSCDKLISGGARGVDRIAEAYGKTLGLRVISYRPSGSHAAGFVVDKWVDEQNTGPVMDQDKPITFPDFTSAAKRRNWWIVWEGYRVLAFWDGFSSGTSHGIAAAVRTGRPLRIWMDGDS